MTDLTSNLLRLNYFDGLELDAEDFKKEQSYHRHKQQMHNRGLHTRGVCGEASLALEVSVLGEIFVNPGLAIDGEGRELLVRERESPEGKTLADFEEQAAHIYLAYDDSEAGANGAADVRTEDFRVDPTDPGRRGLPYVEESAKVIVRSYPPNATDEGERVEVYLGSVATKIPGNYGREHIEIDLSGRDVAGARNAQVDPSTLYKRVETGSGTADPGDGNEAQIDVHAGNENGLQQALSCQYVAMVVPKGPIQGSNPLLSWSIGTRYDPDPDAGGLVKVYLVIKNHGTVATPYEFTVHKLTI